MAAQMPSMSGEPRSMNPAIPHTALVPWSPAVDVLVAAGAEQSQLETAPGEGAHVVKAEAAQESLDLLRRDGLVWPATEPVVHVVMEFHPAPPLVGCEICAESAARLCQRKHAPQDCDVGRASARLGCGGRLRIP